MCYNCGCEMSEDDMGNADNITESTIKHLANLWGQDSVGTKKEHRQCVKFICF